LRLPKGQRNVTGGENDGKKIQRGKKLEAQKPLDMPLTHLADASSPSLLK
jgi:hypothetical protein